MSTKDPILEAFKLFRFGTEGIGTWLTAESDPMIFARLARLPDEPLTKAQLDQLLVLGHQARISEGFFRYYFLSVPSGHPYPVDSLEGHEATFGQAQAILSLEHLRWGFYRLYVDALLFCGNVQAAYSTWRTQSYEQLAAMFHARRFATESLVGRGPAMPMKSIAMDDRYLISEMACKSYGESIASQGDLAKALREAMRAHLASGGGPIAIRKLLESKLLAVQYSDRQAEFVFSADDVLEERVRTEADIEPRIQRITGRFFRAREAAMDNTRLYLSLAGDLDVYLATSMRSRQDFRNIALSCERIFRSSSLAELNLRYFDPTLSAAAGHEDKGLIECLMVKCAKVLIYHAGDKESYGKDAEAAMALSLGKPVIFFCDHEQRKRFYREVHPLSRLIEFHTGVAVGAMVSDSLEQVVEILRRLFTNRMEYRLEQPRPSYLRLHERLTNSVVRLQTSDDLLSETFWNHYHAK